LIFPNSSHTDSPGNPTNGLATVGTLILEWTRLSDLLRDDQYYRLADRAEQYLLSPRGPLANVSWPGLFGDNIYINNGQIASSSGSWSGGADSYYEYLIKAFVYHPTRFSRYKDEFVRAADSAMVHLASRTKRGSMFLARFDGRNTYNDSQHLTCFDGGTFLLAGTVLNRRDYARFGLDLVSGCHDTYTATATGIGPEGFSWDQRRIPASQKAFFDKNGFFITSSYYILRPEVLESMYYAYRYTGDRKYQDWSWAAFQQIQKVCKTSYGFSGIGDVNAQNGGSRSDNQESFFFAELLKYAYLIQADQSSEYHIQGPGSKQKWVFNTEAHPLRVYG